MYLIILSNLILATVIDSKHHLQGTRLGSWFRTPDYCVEIFTDKGAKIIVHYRYLRVTKTNISGSV